MSRYMTFLRHAAAQDRSLGIEDHKRCLTGKGMKQVLAVAEFCRKQGLRPGRLLCSPLVRAVETAGLLADHLPGCPVPEQVDWLRIETPPGMAAGHIRALAETMDGDVWLVGHEPDFGLTVGALLGMEGAPVRIRKASLTRLEYDTASGVFELLWSLPCDLMR
jgi:phosphohistidine phosphatase